MFTVAILGMTGIIAALVVYAHHLKSKIRQEEDLAKNAKADAATELDHARNQNHELRELIACLEGTITGHRQSAQDAQREAVRLVAETQEELITMKAAANVLWTVRTRELEERAVPSINGRTAQHHKRKVINP